MPLALGIDLALDLDITLALDLALVLARAPDEDESARLTRYVGAMERYHGRQRPTPFEYPRRITRSLVEEFSGRPFEYEEILPVFESYVPDVKPEAVSAGTRALADVCLLLFNSNEFIYAY